MAGGVGDGEVVPAGGVLQGEATRLSEDVGLKENRRNWDSFTRMQLQLWTKLTHKFKYCK